MLLCLSLLQACASVPERPGFDEIQADVEKRTGEKIIMDRSDQSAQEAIRALEAEPLTEDNAVRLALLQSPALQAEYQRLRISYADVVQAGLLTNPQLDVTSGFGLDGGATRVGAGLVYNFLELLTRRGNVASATYGFESTKAEIVGAVLSHTLTVRRTHADYIAARAQLTAAEERLSLAEIRRRTARNLYAVDEVDLARVSLEEQNFLEARADTEIAKGNLISARVTLRLGIGHQRFDYFDIPGHSPAIEINTPKFETLRTRALEWHPDLIAARANIKRLRSLAHQQRRGPLVNSAAAGIELEREDGENFVGPSVSLQVPIFDQGQSQITRADALVQRANFLLEQRELQVLADLRTALANMETANSVFTLQQSQQMPTAHANLKLSEQLFEAGEQDIFDVFDARTNLLDARLDLINARRAFQQANYALNEAIGGVAPPR